MSDPELIEELDKLEKKHNVDRWLRLILGLFCIITLLMYIIWGLNGGLPLILSSGLGGMLIGQSIWNWKGSKELKLAQNAINKSIK